MKSHPKHLLPKESRPKQNLTPFLTLMYLLELNQRPKGRLLAMVQTAREIKTKTRTNPRRKSQRKKPSS
jgi:hypothetical protein